MSITNENIMNIINEAPVGIIAFDEEFNVVYANETVYLFADVFNVKKLIGEKVDSIIPDEYNSKLEKLKEEFAPFEILLNKKKKNSGEEINFILKAVPIENEGEFSGGIIVIEDLITLEEAEGINIVKTKLFEKLLNRIETEFAFFTSSGELFYAPKNISKKSLKILTENFSIDFSGTRKIQVGSNYYLLQISPVTEIKSGEIIYFATLNNITQTAEKINELDAEIVELKNLLAKTECLIFYNERGEILKKEFGDDALLKKRFEEIKEITEINEKTARENFFTENSTFFFAVKSQNIFKHYLSRVLKFDDKFVLSIVNLPEDFSEFVKEKSIGDVIDIFNNYAETFIWKAERDENGSMNLDFCTTNVERITGYSSSTLLKSKYMGFRLAHPNDRKQLFETLRKTVKCNENCLNEIEFRIFTKNHKIIWLKKRIFSIVENGVTKKLIAIVSNITQEKEKEEKLLNENKKLKEINEAKDRFISIISHDLRSPFTSILGFTKLILEQNLPPDKTREYVNFIQNSANSMLNLVNALLDWTRLQTGRIKFAPRKISLYEVVQSSVEMLAGAAIQKGVRLENLTPRSIYIHGDKNLLLQVFNNLIGNAIKFTKEGDSITINATKDKTTNTVRISVKDTGVGIKKEDLPKLFKVDAKFTNPGTAGEKGTGLGLSLVYEIIKKHGGEITVESEYGKGTEFIFTLPISSSIVLLIDKNPAELILYSKLITSLFPELKVITASKKSEIEEIVEKKSPVLIITETKTDGYDVFEFAGSLKDKQNKMLDKIIVLARELSESDKKELQSLGINTLFQKPVDLTVFKSAINSKLRS